MNMVIDSSAITLIQHREGCARSRWLIDNLGCPILREHRSSCPGSGSSPTSFLGPLVTAQTFPIPRVLQMVSNALKVLGPRPAAVRPSTRSRVV